MQGKQSPIITFNSREKAGLVVLLSILTLLVAIKATMHLWVKPSYDREKEQQLLQAWEEMKESVRSGHVIVNINTADSVTLVSLKGIGPVTAHKILLYRAENGPFTNVKQLGDVASFPRDVFAELETHLTVADKK